MKWLPIESAPKDGARILIHCPRGRHKVQEVSWCIPYEGCPDGYWTTPHGPMGRGYTILPEAAAHWMPLPPPPVDTSAIKARNESLVTSLQEAKLKEGK